MDKQLDKLKVFISYSRRDVTVAEEVVAGLEEAGLEVVIDRRDLPYGEQWQEELSDFIRTSDTVVWLVSPDSLNSKWCNWELGQVLQLNKRLIPVRVGDVAVEDLPEALGRIHILPVEGIYSAGVHLDALVTAVESDRGWVKEHTRLASRAREWDTHDHAPALLLRGAALKKAEAWKDRHPASAPKPSQAVLDLILQSRRGATRRQRYIVAGAVFVTLLSTTLSGLALWQRNIAQTEAQRARHQLAERISVDARRSIDDSPQRAVLLSVEALRLSLDNTEDPPPEVERVSRNAVASMGGIGLEGINYPINAVRILPDGTGILIIDKSGGVSLRHFDGREAAQHQLGLLEGEELSTAAFDNTGRYVATISTRRVFQLWRLIDNTRTDLLHEEQLQSSTLALTFGPNARRLALARWTEGDSVDVFTIESNTVERTTLRGQPHQVSNIAFSPDGTMVATGDWRGVLRIWSFDDPAESMLVYKDELANATNRSDAVRGLAFAPDGKTLIVSVGDRLRLISETSDDRVFAFRRANDSWTRSELSGHKGGARDIAISPDGSLLAVATTEGFVRFWKINVADTEFSSQIKLVPQNPTAIAFLNRSKLLIGTDDRRVGIYDVPNNFTDFADFELLGHEKPVYDIRIGPAQRYILTRGGDNVPRLWDMRASDPGGSPIQEPFTDAWRWRQLYAGQGVSSVYESSDKNWLVVGRRGTPLQLWGSDQIHEGPVELEQTGEDLSVVTLASQASWLAAGGFNGHLNIWDLSITEGVRQAHSFTEDDGVASLSFTPEGAWLATAFKRGKVWLLRMEDNAKPSQVLLDNSGIERAVFARHGRLLIIKTGSRTRAPGSSDPSLLFFTFDPTVGPKSLQEIARIPAAEGGLFISDSGRFIAHPTHEPIRSRSHNVLVDDAVTIYDMTAKDIKASRRVLPGPMGVSKIVFAPNDDRVAALSDGQAYLWSLHAQGEDVPIVLSVSKSFFAIAFDPEGHYFAAGDGDIDGKGEGEVLLWPIRGLERTEPRHFTVGNQPVSTVAFLSGERLFAGDWHQRFRIFSLNPTRVAEAGCQASSRNMTLEEWREYFGSEPYRLTCQEIPPHPTFVRDITTKAVNIARVEGDVSGALGILNQGLLRGHVDMNQVSKEIANALVERSAAFLRALQASAAVQSLDDARSVYADVNLSYRLLNDLCHVGGIFGDPDRVNVYCDLAMKLAPKSEQDRIADARGMVRALRGDYHGAVQDFTRFIVFAQRLSGRYPELVAQRRQWIEQLKNGQNPINEQEITRVREQTRGALFD